MKKTFLIALTLLTNFVFAQTQLSDYYDASSANRPEFSYNIVVKIHKTTGATEYDTRYTATLVQASPDSKGFYNAYGDNKYYSCSQLGDVCKPNNLHLVSIRLSYTCNGQQKADVVVFRNLNDVEQINTVYGAGGKLCESLDFSMKVMGVVIEPIHLGQIMNKINQIGTTKTTQNNTNSNNQSTQTNSKDTQTNETKSYELKLSDIGIPENNSSTTSDYQKNYETGQQLGELANNVVDIFSPSPEKIARQAEEVRLRKKREVEAEDYFKRQLNQYLDSAKSGNESSRMILVCLLQSNLAWSRNFTNYIPDYKEWVFTASKNNNFDAMNILGWNSLNLRNDGSAINFGLNKTDGVKLLEQAANLGSVDAMYILGLYYNQNKNCMYGKDSGGGDPEKSLKWYRMAAENGNAQALYSLGMIYTYKEVWKDMVCIVKFKVKKDYPLAADYFNESLKAQYKEDSHFFRSFKDVRTTFNSSAYELYLKYKNGIGCEKNIELADKYYKIYKS